MNRFYKQAAAVPTDAGFGVALDGRPIRTPVKALLNLPTRALADAIAGEWNAQGDKIDPRAMPLTGLANAAIDKAEGSNKIVIVEQALREIDAAARPNEPVIFWRGGGYPLYPNDAYRNTSYYRRKPTGPIVLLTEKPDAAMIERIRAWPSVLVIAPMGDLEPVVPGATLTLITKEPGAGQVYRASP